MDIDARRNRSGKSPITQEQRAKIQKASDKAYEIVRKGYNDLNKIVNQSGRPSKRRRKRRKAWNKNGKVTKWFGKSHLTYSQIKWTRNRLSGLKRLLESTVEFTIIQHQGGSRSWLCRDGSPPDIAYTGGRSPIKLCPRFFWDSDEQRVRTVVHELCHHVSSMRDQRYGAGGEVVYFPNIAKKLAIHYSRRARRNPTNIAYFCFEYYYLK